MKLALLVFLIFGVSVSPHCRGEESHLSDLNEASSNFALNFFDVLGKENKGNLFMSPVSVQILLALIYTGTKGNTAKELETLLSLPPKLEDTLESYSSLIHDLQNPVLALANRLFVEKTSPVKEDFQRNAEKYFQSPAESLDFHGAPEKSRRHINSWVESKTNNKIKDLLAPRMINALTKLVLVNAIHFKAQWLYKFPKILEKPFWISANVTVPVKMMQREGHFRKLSDDILKAKIIELEYAEKEFRMLVIKPYSVDGLSEVEAKLGKVNLFKKLKNLREPMAKTFQMPMFKLESTMDLASSLSSLGVSSMFSSNADFKGLSEKPLTVSKFVQKAFVDVNQNGTEAAAATTVLLVPRSGFPRQILSVDRPFLFLIMFKDTPLFIGRVTEPQGYNM